MQVAPEASEIQLMGASIDQNGPMHIDARYRHSFARLIIASLNTATCILHSTL